METLEDIRLYFYIACGVTAAILLILIILVCILFVKVNALLAADGSNQLSRQANMMADFCYTNPTIVPGEELSRRGFSMYRGTDYTSGNMFGLKKDYAVHQEQRSKF